MSLDAYVEHVRDLLDGVPDLRFRRMFGGVGVYSGPRMFALVFGEQLFLKADAGLRDALAAQGSEPFVFEARGRLTTTSYWRLPADAEDDRKEAGRWSRLALEAAHRARRPTGRSPQNPRALEPGP